MDNFVDKPVDILWITFIYGNFSSNLLQIKGVYVTMQSEWCIVASICVKLRRIWVRNSLILHDKVNHCGSGEDAIGLKELVVCVERTRDFV